MTDPSYAVRLAGWILLQVTWQGLAFLPLYVMARRTCRRGSPAERYGVGASALVLLTVIPLATLLLVDRAARAAGLAAAERSGGAASAAASGDRRVAGVLVAIWIVGVLIGLARLAVGHIRIGRVVRHAVPGPHAGYVAALAHEIGLKCAPRVAESRDIAVPLVAGWRNPALLLPAGLGDDLHTWELRALVLHELAHVRRRDYAVNLLQRALEIVLWHQPAVWLASRDMRREREHCCDEDAARACGRPLVLARALVVLEERRSAPSLALAADGGELSRRVQRLLATSRDRGQRKGRATRAAGASGIAIAACALIVAGSVRSAPVDGALRRVVPVVRVDAVDPAGSFSLELIAGRVRRASIAGNEVAPEGIVQRGTLLRLSDPDLRTDFTLRITRDGQGIAWQARRPLSRSP